MRPPTGPWQMRLLLLLAAWLAACAQADDRAAERAAMLEEIDAAVAYTRAETGVDRLAPRVVASLAEVPRHEFVPPEARALAYANRPLPVGHGQTISQPYIVALMTELLALDADSKVLEIGTGSGYQAAVLAELAASVYTIEIVRPLGEQASRRLARLGYDNVRTRIGDGYYGWPEAAPFDAIMVTAAGTHVPPPLVGQLRPGGRMVLPVGGRFAVQQLLLVVKDAHGEVQVSQILPVRFVPLTGGH